MINEINFNEFKFRNELLRGVKFTTESLGNESKSQLKRPHVQISKFYTFRMGK